VNAAKTLDIPTLAEQVVRAKAAYAEARQARAVAAGRLSDARNEEVRAAGALAAARAALTKELDR
jgi:hypothetical protein